LIECDTFKKHLITNTQDSELGQIKNRGSLMRLSLDVQTTCLETEKVSRGYNNEIMSGRKNMQFYRNESENKFLLKIFSALCEQ